MDAQLTLLALSVCLSAVFAVAGIAKLCDRAGSSAATRSFGVPPAVAGVVGLVLSILELSIAFLLLPVATRWHAAAAALVLLLAFTVAIVRAMARGEAPECHCFGQLHSAPASWRTLARNLALAGLAGFVVVAGRDDSGSEAFAWTARLEDVEWLALALGIVLVVVTVVGGYVAVHVMRSYGRVLVRLEQIEEKLREAGFDLDEPDDVLRLGLEPGTAAPAFWLPSVEGDRVALGDLLGPGRPALLVFTSPTCGPCSHLMPAVAAWQREHADKLTVALLSAGAADAVSAEAEEHGLEHVLLDEALTAYESYEANGTPSAVLVADDGTIAAWLAAGSEWIESLVEHALGGLGTTPGLPVGSEIPSELADAIEGDTVLLFWNPDCGFCRAMHEELRSWEASPPAGAPALLVVSSGAEDDIRAEGFRSPVVLDSDWALASRLGADGTPMAVLVGLDRRVASPLVTGGEAVFGLLGAEVAAAV